MEWMPIKAAPRDGALILAWAGDPFTPSFYYYGVAQWANADPDFPDSVNDWFWPYAIRPTHWMPLPPPPLSDKD